jgi:hypothetical protein
MLQTNLGSIVTSLKVCPYSPVPLASLGAQFGVDT